MVPFIPISVMARSMGMAEHRGDLSSSTIEGSPFIRTGTRETAENSPPTPFPTNGSPEFSSFPSSFGTASLSTAETNQMADDMFSLIGYPSEKHAIMLLRVFLLDISMLMDDESRRIFESVALTFIVDGIDQDDLFIVADINVIDQRLTWTRLVEGKHRTGLDVSFEAGVAFSRDMERHQFKATLQAMLEEKAEAFHESFNLALQGSGHIASLDESESTAGFTFETIRLPFALALTFAGCLGVIVILSHFYFIKKRESAEDLSDASAEAGHENRVHGRLESYPIQQISQLNVNATKQQNWHDISSESDTSLPVDDCSFNFSLGAERQRTDIGAINFECDESVISTEKAAGSYCEDSLYELVEVEKRHHKTLTVDDLRNFDDEMRRAEC